MRKLFLAGAALGMLGSSLLAAEGPSAQEILERARLNQMSQQQELKAQIRTGATKIPLRITLDGPEIRYEFSDPKQIIVVKMGEKGSRVEEITENGASKVSSNRFDSAVRGSDFTYEDLSLGFLYWKNAKFLPDEAITVIPCYRLELRPNTDSQYSIVRAWISKKDGALVKAECYGPKGTLSAKIQAVGTKTIKIYRMKDGASRNADPTYLKLLD